MDENLKKKLLAANAKQRTQEAPYVVSCIRQYAAIQNMSFALSDEKIYSIYDEVKMNWGMASTIRGKGRVHEKYIHSIVFAFTQICDLKGDEFYISLLKSELDDFVENGLQDYYREELDIFEYVINHGGSMN